MSCCIRLCDQLGLGEWGELARCEHRMHGIAWDCEGEGEKCSHVCMHEYARVLHGRGTIACKSENWEKCYHSGYLFFFFFFFFVTDFRGRRGSSFPSFHLSIIMGAIL